MVGMAHTYWKQRGTYNYTMFKSIGFNDTIAYEKGNEQRYTQEMIIDDVATTYEPVFMRTEPAAASSYQAITLAKIKQVLNLPDMHQVCPRYECD
jgi:hypothetical protein